MSAAATRTGGAPVVFATSGSTGATTSWVRTPDQLRAEAELIGDTLIGDVDEIICYAPPQHLFGRLFGDVLPGLRGVEVRQLAGDPFVVPRLRAGSRVLIVCLPSTWVTLRRLVPELNALGRLVLLHGAGPTTPVTDDVLGALSPATTRAVELFGSTETGAVAHRDAAPAWSRTPWHVLPDVTLLSTPDREAQRLRVGSPRLARRAGTETAPASLTTDDVIRVLGAGRFEYLGRVSRLLKVNGRRCNLDHLEQLTQVLLGRPVACVPVRDSIRGEHYELFYQDTTGLAERDVWRRLAPLARSVPVPRDVHAVREIPLTVAGKIKIDQLYAEAGRERRS